MQDYTQSLEKTEKTSGDGMFSLMERKKWKLQYLERVRNRCDFTQVRLLDLLYALAPSKTLLDTSQVFT